MTADVSIWKKRHSWIEKRNSAQTVPSAGVTTFQCFPPVIVGAALLGLRRRGGPIQLRAELFSNLRQIRLRLANDFIQCDR